MRDTKRLLLVLLVGLLASGVGGAALIRQPAAKAADNPATKTVVVHHTEPAAVADTVPDVTTTTAKRPVDVPNDPYAPEPVQQIGTIEIPKIGLVHPIFHGITLRNIDHGPSHWPGTAMPGENGNAVFAGHRVTHTHPFLRINELVEGDQVIFTVDGVRSVYQVTGHEVVTPDDMGITKQTATPTATLFACHPPHSASYRYVVHLALVSVG
jgi:sortase A